MIYNTENRENWSCIIFDVHKDAWDNMLVDLNEFLKSIGEIELPHYRFGNINFQIGFITLCLRFLRLPEHATLVNEKIQQFLKEKGIPSKISTDLTDKNDQWLDPFEISKNARWNRKRCEALHEVYKLVVFLTKEGILDYRCEFSHLLINMLVGQEIIPR